MNRDPGDDDTDDLVDLAHALARRSDPETSHEAAAAVNLPKLKGEVLAVLQAHPEGLTSYECADLMRRPLVCISPVFARLVDVGLAHNSGEKRRGETGHRRIVWKAGAGP